MNAIVILILAIVFLGLALAFVTDIFGTMGTEFEEGFDVVTKQRVDQLRTTHKEFDLETYTVNIMPEGRRILFMLVRNTDSLAPSTWNFFYDNAVIDPIANPFRPTEISGNCDDVDVALKPSLTIPPNTEMTPPLLVKAGTTPLGTTCLFEIKIDTNVDGSVDKTAELIINII